MTRDDIIRMAREASLPAGYDDQLKDFAGLVAAAEREQCAKVCDAVQPDDPWETCSAHKAGQFEMAEYLAEQIRAKGKT